MGSLGWEGRAWNGRETSRTVHGVGEEKYTGREVRCGEGNQNHLHPGRHSGNCHNVLHWEATENSENGSVWELKTGILGREVVGWGG